MIYNPTDLFRILRARVIIDGVEYSVVGFPEVDRSLDNMLSTCGITLAETPPESAIYSTATVDYSIDNGVTWYRLFTGVLQPDQFSYAPLEYRYTITDVLYKLDTTATSDISLSGVGYLDAIEDILLAAGISAGDIDLPGTVESDVVDRATITEYVVEQGDSLQTTMQELLDFGRYRLYTDANGVVKAVKYSRVPYENPSIHFSTQPSTSEYGIISITSHLEPNQEIVNTVTVDGEGEDISGEWTTGEVSGKGATGFRNSFCTTVAQCEELAQDIGIDECRSERTYDVKMPVDHNLVPGTCIKIKAPEINIGSLIPVRVIKQSINGPTMDLVCSAGGRAIDDEGTYDPDEEVFDPIRPPTATFNYSLEREAADYGLYLDASLSTSEAGDIVSYTWVINGTTEGYPRPMPTATAKTFVLVEDTEGVSITLSIEDSEGNTASVTQDISANIIIPMTRMLSALVSDRWCVLITYAIGWLDITPEGVVPYIIPRYQDDRYFFMLATNGKLYRFDTKNAGFAPIVIGEFSGVGGHVNYYTIEVGEALHSSESGNTLIIGGKGFVWRSKNILYPPENITYYPYIHPELTPITAARIHTKNPNIVTAVFSEDIRKSYDDCVTFEEPFYDGSEEYEGEDSSEIYDLIKPNFAQDYVAFRKNQTDLTEMFLPSYIDWSAVTPAPTNFTAIAPSHFYAAVYFGTDTGQIYSYEYGTNILQHLITVPPDDSGSNMIAQMLPDRTYEQILWLRIHHDTYSIAKLISHTELNAVFQASLYIEDGDGSMRVPKSSLGYGPIGEHETKFTRNHIWIIPTLSDYYDPQTTEEERAAQDFIWRLDTSTGRWAKITPPIPLCNWYYLKVSGETMFLFGTVRDPDYPGSTSETDYFNTRSFVSYDAGYNWTELQYFQSDYDCTCPTGSAGSSVAAVMQYGSTWYLLGKCRLDFGYNAYYYIALFVLSGSSWVWQLNITQAGRTSNMVAQCSSEIIGGDIIYRTHDGGISVFKDYFYGRYNIPSATNYRTKLDHYTYFPRICNCFSGGFGYLKLLYYPPTAEYLFMSSSVNNYWDMRSTASGYTVGTATEDYVGERWGHDYTYDSKGTIYAVRKASGGTYRAGVNIYPYPFNEEDIPVTAPETCNEYDAGFDYDRFNANIECSTDDTVVVLDRAQGRVVVRNPDTEIWSAIPFPEDVSYWRNIAPHIQIQEV